MAQPDYAPDVQPGLMWVTAAFDPDHDGDDDSKPSTDKDHDWWSADGRPLRPQALRQEAASGLPQIQQHTDPNNAPDPEGDQLPVGVAFPLGDNSPQSASGAQWSTASDGPQARTGAFQVEAVSWARRHYEQLAGAISGLPEHLRHPVAREFAEQMPHPRNGLGPFDSDKFITAATDPGSYSWRSQGRHPAFSRGHYEAVADMLGSVRNSGHVSAEDFSNHVYPAIAGAMHAGAGFTPSGNRNFDEARFRARAHGEAAPRRARAPQPQRSYNPPPRQQQTYDEYGERVPEAYVQPRRSDYETHAQTWDTSELQRMPREHDEAEYDPVFGWRGTAMLRRLGYAGDVSSQGATSLGHADAMNNENPVHKDQFGSSKQKHRRYLEGWNQTAGLIHGLVGRAPMSKAEYAQKTGREDLHSHYLAAYAQGRTLHGQSNSLYRADDGGQATASLRVQGDAWSQPHRTTDDFAEPFNSPATTPDPWSQNGSPQSSDYQAGVSAGQSDKAAGERPLFADNSSGVSPYVKGYAQGYGQGQGPAAPQDVPRSMGGDSGQGVNAEEARQSFQVARASRRTASVQDAWQDARDNLEQQHQVDGGHAISGAPGSEQLEGEGTGGRSGATWKTASLRRVSAAFAPDSLMGDADFRKGYLFARKWRPGQRLAGQGSARFEAGVYAGVTDSSPAAQDAWVHAHAVQGGRHRELVRRIGLHESFTAKMLGGYGHPTSRYLPRTAGTSTDLITDGPGTSPDPMGSTPLNGPGAPPPMAGRDEASAAGGAPPYQGAAPLPGGPVVPDDVMGPSQRSPEPSGPFTNTFSGRHPENVTLAPVAPSEADQSGYTNQSAYAGDPHGNDRLAAFRTRVQAGLAQMGAR